MPPWQYPDARTASPRPPAYISPLARPYSSPAIDYTTPMASNTKCTLRTWPTPAAPASSLTLTLTLSISPCTLVCICLLDPYCAAHPSNRNTTSLTAVYSALSFPRLSNPLSNGLSSLPCSILESILVWSKIRSTPLKMPNGGMFTIRSMG